MECEVVRTVPGCCVTARGRGRGLGGRLDRGTPDEHGPESCRLSRNLGEGSAPPAEDERDYVQYP